jgi:hypothetical protein
LRNKADEEAAAAARGELAHDAPVVFELGRSNRIEVELVCARLKSEGLEITWYFQSPAMHAGAFPTESPNAFVLARPADAEYVRGELIESGLLYVG